MYRHIMMDHYHFITAPLVPIHSKSPLWKCITSNLFQKFPRWQILQQLRNIERENYHLNISRWNFAPLECKICVWKCWSQSFQITSTRLRLQHFITTTTKICYVANSHNNNKYVTWQIVTTAKNIFPDKFSNRVHIFRCVEHVHECWEPSQVQLPHPGQGDQGQGDDDNGD